MGIESIGKPATPPSLEDIFYTVSWPVSNARPGAHPGLERGLGQRFLGLLRFLDYPDPRRLDLKASVLDPFQIARVRSYAQRSAISVCMIADLSASMGFSGTRFKMETLACFVSALSAATERLGDRFAFIGCDSRVREEWTIPAGYGKGRGEMISRRLAAFQPRAANASGLAGCHYHLPPRRSLVFLVSDFHLPLSLIEKTLGALAKHDVVPVVLWDSGEFTALPVRGLVRLDDPESKERRILWLRPLLKERIARAFDERRRRLTRLFQRFGRRPLLVVDRVEAERLSEYFLQQ
ncbi:MAG: MxaS protein [Methylococcaceae bacterium]|nr:MxaS protein [Methylococcaceae bacterium]